MKFIKGLLKRLLGLVIFLVIVGVLLVTGAQAYCNTMLEIDLFKTVGHVRTLTKEVDEANLCPNAFSADDMVDVEGIVNSAVEDLIQVSPDGDYVVDFDNLPSEIKTEISLEEKQVGALAQTLIQQEMQGEMEIGVQELTIDLKQIDFTIVDSENTLVNVVIALDIAPLKENLGKLDFLKTKIPNTIYISSTVNVKKEGNFGYKVTHNAFTVNSLNAEDTSDLFNALNKLLKTGTVNKINEAIGQIVMDALVGAPNGEEQGLARSLEEIGATGYRFDVVDGADCFVVEIEVNPLA